MKLIRSSGATIALLLVAGLAFGQEFRGRVQGVVKDPSGAAVPKAAVTLANDATGIQTQRASSAEGHYLFWRIATRLRIRPKMPTLLLRIWQSQIGAAVRSKNDVMHRAQTGCVGR